MRRARLLALMALLVLAPAHAGIVITGTRVVYPAEQRDVSVNLRNTGQTPSLVQAWVDDGGPGSDPARATDSPFLVTPPVSRVDPGKGVLLKLAHLQAPLPQDRESVFWLNVLEIPAQGPKDAAATPASGANGATSGSMQIAFRSQIKIFYRPTGLAGTPAEAAGQLDWTLVSVDGRTVLRATNALPYHVSPTRVEISQGSRRHVHNDLDMVPPLGHYDIALPADVAAWAGSGARVRYAWINDFGGRVESEAAIR